MSADIFSALDEAYDSELSDSETEEEGRKETRNKKHKSLLNDISAITGVPNKRSALRSEPASQIDEHLWSQKSDSKDRVKLNDLLQSVKQTSTLGSFKKKIAKFEKSHSVLETPLPKPQKEKIQRTIAYSENRKEISKWEPTVIKNREAENLSFPLNPYKPQEVTTKSVAVNFKPRSSLEKEIAAVLKGSSVILERRNKELTESEEKALQAVDLEEAMTRRKELQKLRALQSYYEIKCKRLKKIKSKKFRKIHRKSEQKKKEKESTNATEEEKEALTEQAEKNRVLERAHLRHRNTSKWAKKLMSKDNKSVEEKQLLHDQLQVSRKLTEQKSFEPDTDEELEVGPNEGLSLLQKSTENSDNPWLLGQDCQSIKGVTGFGEKSKQKEGTSDESEEESEPENEVKSDDEWNVAGQFAQSSVSKKKPSSRKREHTRSYDASRKKNLKLEDNSDLDSDEESVDALLTDPGFKNAKKSEKSSNENSVKVRKTSKSSPKEMNPDNFLSVESKALDVDVLITDNSEVDFTKSEEQRSKVREAFANDAVMEEFELEKKKIQEKRLPKDIDFALPGWGEWAGAAIDNEQLLRRKRKKFLKKGKKQAPSKDEKLKHVILNEEKNKRFAANQVSSLPFPFSNESHFEKSVRQPLGKTWNTPSVSAKLTQPRISTLIGTIIDPIKKTKEISKVNINNANKNPEFISKKVGRK